MTDLELAQPDARSTRVGLNSDLLGVLNAETCERRTTRRDWTRDG
jgi:hypothetical protein